MVSEGARRDDAIAKHPGRTPRGAKMKPSVVKAVGLSPEELAQRPLNEYPGWDRWGTNKRRCLDMLPLYRSMRATSIAAGMRPRYMDTQRKSDPLYAAAIDARMLAAPGVGLDESEIIDLMRTEAQEFLYDLVRKARNANNGDKLTKGDEIRIKLGMDAAKQITSMDVPSGRKPATKLKKQHEVLGGKTERVDVQDDESASNLNAGIGLTFLNGSKR